MSHSATKGILFENSEEAKKFLDDILRVLSIKVDDLGDIYGLNEDIGEQIKENRKPLPFRFFETICGHTELTMDNYTYKIVPLHLDKCSVCQTPTVGAGSLFCHKCGFRFK
ncbi:MAG: hypothetical protein APF76_02455 [Desulfitibacter sp. BRH_c19]|nr:MAG: hypothetical protein APF76_02455 [Desulfitibacter sp. BRH_c19]